MNSWSSYLYIWIQDALKKRNEKATLKNEDLWEFAAYFALFVLISLTGNLIKCYSTFIFKRALIKVRTSMLNLVMEKLLVTNFSNKTNNNIDEGRIMNLISNDIYTFESLFWVVSFVIQMVIDMVIVTFITTSQIGHAIFVIYGCILVNFLINFFLIKCIYYIKMKTMQLSDKRIAAVKNVLANVNFIKVNA